jgi:hypothetical protein
VLNAILANGEMGAGSFLCLLWLQGGDHAETTSETNEEHGVSFRVLGGINASAQTTDSVDAGLDPAPCQCLGGAGHVQAMRLCQDQQRHWLGAVLDLGVGEELGRRSFVTVGEEKLRNWHKEGEE